MDIGRAVSGIRNYECNSEFIVIPNFSEADTPYRWCRRRGRPAGRMQRRRVPDLTARVRAALLAEDDTTRWSLRALQRHRASRCDRRRALAAGRRLRF